MEYCNIISLTSCTFTKEFYFSQMVLVLSCNGIVMSIFILYVYKKKIYKNMYVIEVLFKFFEDI